MDAAALIDALKRDANMAVLPPAGLPVLRPGDVLPDDLRAFYSLCGGVRLYIDHGGFPLVVLPPSRVIPANPALLGSNHETDLSHSWYLLIDAMDGNFITIDLSPVRQGRCYESFEYSHAVRGNCPVVGVSFLDLMARIIGYRGDYFFWRDPAFISLGDAYDMVNSAAASATTSR